MEGDKKKLGLTEINSNIKEVGRVPGPTSSRANQKYPNITKPAAKTLRGKENDLADPKEGVKNIFQVCF